MFRLAWKAFLPICIISNTHAQLVTNLPIVNPKALALANSVTADPVGIDSIHFNPAGLALIDSREANVKLIAGYLDMKWDIKQRCDLSAQCPNDVLGQQWQNAIESFNDEYPDDPQSNTSGSTHSIYFVTPGGNADTLPFALVPVGGMAFRSPSNEFTLATAIYAPEGGGYDRGDQPGGFQGKKVGLTRITYLSPSVAFQVSDGLYFGASMGISWQGIALETDLRAPLITLQVINNAIEQLSLEEQLQLIMPYDNLGTLNLYAEDSFSTSFNVGVLWKPSLWFSLGAAYRSQASNQLEGNYRFENSESLSSTSNTLLSLLGNYQDLAVLDVTAKPTQTGKVTLDYTVPQYFALGTSIQITQIFTMNVDFKWVDYESLRAIEFEFSESTDITSIAGLANPQYANKNTLILPRNHRSTWGWSIGLEYQIDALTTTRAGYEYRPSAAPDDHLDLLLPISEAQLYGLGLSRKLNNYSEVEMAIGYIVSDYEIPACSSKVINHCGPASLIYNPMPAVDISNTTSSVLINIGYTTKL